MSIGQIFNAPNFKMMSRLKKKWKSSIQIIYRSEIERNVFNESKKNQAV